MPNLDKRKTDAIIDALVGCDTGKFTVAIGYYKETGDWGIIFLLRPSSVALTPDEAGVFAMALCTHIDKAPEEARQLILEFSSWLLDIVAEARRLMRETVH